MAGILFVTDSAADIPAPDREQLQIRVLPFPIAMGEKEYLDGVDFQPQQFYTMLEEGTEIPTHAQLTPFVFFQMYQEALDAGYSDLIYTSINSKGSATHQNALQAKEAFYDENPQAAQTLNIHIIDSGTYTMAYGYGVMEGARMAAQGAGAGEIVAFIQDWVAHARILFTPFDLKYAKRSGRISAAAAFVGEALGIKPIMTFENGVSKVLAKIRGEKHVVPGMLDICLKNREPGSPYLVLRAMNLPQSDALSAACREQLDRPPAMECCIGGVIAINAGPNLVGMVYRERS